MSEPVALTPSPESMGAAEFARQRKQDEIDAAMAAYRARHASSTSGVAEALAAKQQRDVIPTEPDVPPETGLQTAGKIAKDIGRGVTELPSAAIGGMAGAVNETLDLADATANWANEKLGTAPGTLPKLPTPDKPTSVTGNLEQGIAQFTTSFVGVGKLKWFKDWRAATKTEKSLKTMTQGAAAQFVGFDAQMTRLSDLIQSNPTLANPVNEFLASNPTDSEAEGRFKNALEGTVSGLMLDGFVKGLKVLRSVKRVQSGIAEQLPVLPADALNTLGDPNEPLFKGSVKGFAAKAGRNIDTQEAGGAPSAEQLLTAEGEPQTFINWARMDTPEDVQTVMQKMADTYKRSIDTSRRGVQSFAQIELNAEQQNAWKLLQERSERGPGATLNAEQSVAVRNLWAASGKKLTDTAAAVMASPSPANLFAFRKMLAIHAAIQEQVISARTEVARALASWRIPVAGGARQLDDINALIESSGGSGVAQDLAKKIDHLARTGQYDKLEKFVNKGWAARTKDAVVEMYVGGLVTNPGTIVINALGNAMTVAKGLTDSFVAEKIRRLYGAEGAAQISETAAMLDAMQQGFPDAVKYAMAAFKTGEASYYTGKVEVPRPGALMSETLFQKPPLWVRDGKLSGSPLGLISSTLGWAYQGGFRTLGATDEVFKTILYRGKVAQMATRRAAEDLDAGRIASGVTDEVKRYEAFAQQRQKYLDEPPDDIHLSSVDYAKYNTFTAPLGTWGQFVQSQANKHLVIKFIVPFARVSSNILSYTLDNSPLAPLMAKNRELIAQGGPAAEEAVAKIATGTAIMLWAADQAMRGNITGNGPQGAGRETWLRNHVPASITLSNGMSIQLSRLDPLGSQLIMAADMVNILANDPWGSHADKEWDDAWATIVFSSANMVFRKSYMQAVGNTIEAITDPNRAPGWKNKLLASFVPTALGAAARQNDPYLREADGAIQALMRKTPGMSDQVRPAVDLWGRFIDLRSPLGAFLDATSPVMVRQINPEPIDKEIESLKCIVEDLDPRRSVGQVPIDLRDFPDSNVKLAQLAGNELKLPALPGHAPLGAMDYLNLVVTGKAGRASDRFEKMTKGPQGERADYIRSVITRYRAVAWKSMISPRGPNYDEALHTAIQNNMLTLQKQQQAARAAPLIPAQQPSASP